MLGESGKVSTPDYGWILRSHFRKHGDQRILSLWSFDVSFFSHFSLFRSISSSHNCFSHFPHLWSSAFWNFYCHHVWYSSVSHLLRWNSEYSNQHLWELVNGMLKRLLKYIYMYFTLLGRYFTIQYLLGLSLISITLKIMGNHCHQKIYQVIATSNANYSLGDDGEIWFKFLDTFDLFTGNWKS